MVLIYTESISPRLEYTLELVFRSILKTNYQLVLDMDDIHDDAEVLINYSMSDIPNSITFRPYGLLSETDIQKQVLSISTFEELPVFFDVDGGEWPFDPFSMIFYLVSRYEEYMPDVILDKHLRFQAIHSLAYKEGFLHLPLVNMLASKLRSLVENRAGKQLRKPSSFTFVPTFDIDMVFAHQDKGMMRILGGYAKLILKLKLKDVFERTATLCGLMRDPYNNFEYLKRACQEKSMPALFFVNVGNTSPYDKNVSYKSKRQRSILRNLNQNFRVGLHPSYYSIDKPELIAAEKARLEDLLQGSVFESRQHYLRFRLPDTYSALSEAGITDDYSMGYASHPGFRASICTPFYFYDLKQNRKSKLKIHPFAFMDTTFEHYMPKTPQEMVEYVRPIIEESKSCGCSLSGVWHNYAISNHKDKLRAFRKIIEIAS